MDKTLTLNNGKAFAQLQKTRNLLNAKAYFTKPYTSQDKGTVKNKIDVIKRYLPKKTDLKKVSDTRIKEIERKINYNNPIEVLTKKSYALMG